MTQIRPVSDLRNKFSKIETLVAERQAPVFLTKKWLCLNGRYES